MNSDIINKIITDHSKLSETDIEQIKIEIEKYPYFHLLYVALAIKYFNNSSQKFSKTRSLELASIYSPNRKHLKQTLKSINNLKKEQKDEFQTDLALKNTKLNKDIISEKLANIMLEQGEILEAINIYEQLCLKMPQKKAYFVNKIKTLEVNKN